MTDQTLFTGVDFITVSTKDYDAAAKFYGDGFGLEFRPNTHPIEFHVEDFEGAKAELESRGIEFEGETLDSGVCYQAFFHDPDGNALAIHHRYAPQ